MKNYIEIIELTDASNQSKVVVSAAFQGRVMTRKFFISKAIKML
ncbi:DUF6786 family protein [Algibacter miyuki]|uniref:DUF6786 family protein n=1 Tax=Algibacter miyuki TaxID=1306933 RepID=A0ABV5H0J4_9FLAO